MSKFFKLFEQVKEKQEMEEHFEKRTNMHIGLVKKNWKKLYDSKFSKHLPEDPDEHIEQHDQSKFKEPEYTPYLFISWKYEKEKRGEDWEIPEDMKQKSNDATTHHVFNNSHHPVYWDDSAKPEDNVINSKDRDKPTGHVTDGTKMPNWAICEMLCDWAAVSEERNSSLKGWADMNVGEDKRWKFTDDQTKLIYDLVEFFEPEEK